MVAEEDRDGFVAPEPGGRTTGFADEGAELAAPETQDAVVAEDG